MPNREKYERQSRMIAKGPGSNLSYKINSVDNRYTVLYLEIHGARYRVYVHIKWEKFKKNTLLSFSRLIVFSGHNI